MLKLILLKHGLKTSQPLPSAHLYVDCRTMKEHGVSGSDAAFVKANWNYLENQRVLIERAIELIPERRAPAPPYEKPFVICFLCAWGQTRSRITRDYMAGCLKSVNHVGEIELV